MSTGGEISTVTQSMVAELQREFDQGFARPARPDESAVENLLAIGLGGDSYAIRLREVAGLLSKQRIVALPTPVDELLGVSGLRGAVVPVYSLAALLGYRRSDEAPPWTILLGPELVGLAFETLEGHLRASPDELAAERGGDARSGARPFLAETARIGSRTYGIIDLRAVRSALEARARSGQRASGSLEER